MAFGQLLTAMVTPFHENGDIHWEQVEQLTEHLIATKSDGVVVAGTTGESPTLSSEEKLQLFRLVKDIAGSRMDVIGGVGTNNTAYSADLANEATKIGIDGLMAVTPYYNKPNQEGMYQHFQRIAAATTLPLMIYNIPGRCIVNLLPETLLRLAEVSNITSVKEACGNLDQISHFLSSAPKDFQLFSGDDSLTLPTLSVGGDGVVSVAAHIAGEDLKQMMTDFFSGRVQRAAEAHRTLLPKMRACFMAPNPSPVKAMLEQMGITGRYTRLPLVPLTDAEIRQLEQWFTAAS
ncbi:4-hydroxy-tetrahydrodipicolinate synthase [Marinococcus sp. PL1-022]|uniref:4-hydroxy-tetrahydrodipicolinate synthase n=1 Tax=Marinococcus sp. PL1-022 TaxID=3095363 RepID=UPI0029C33325|nr:4-hydroxy-tetrahydrodipicolinate synthase [Marinococcus sp. PL1-022]MDX6152513.1 4-hydroxy-tetrahydrodipicolinate synthase [Marinococcus sp. PL1-022]